jgi:hypothetical protein
MRPREPSQFSPWGTAVKEGFAACPIKPAEDDPVWRIAWALWRFDRGEPEMARAIAACIVYGVLDCPPGRLRRILGDIASGERKPGKRSKYTAEVQWKAALDLGAALDHQERVRANAESEADRSRGAALVSGHVARIASGAGTLVRFKGASEPADLVSESLERVAADKARIAAAVPASVATVEAWERNLRSFLLDLAND